MMVTCTIRTQKRICVYGRYV